MHVGMCKRFVVGEQVLMRDNKPVTKLQDRWLGPMVVMQVNKNDTYLLAGPNYLRLQGAVNALSYDSRGSSQESITTIPGIVESCYFHSHGLSLDGKDLSRVLWAGPAFGHVVVSGTRRLVTTTATTTPTFTTSKATCQTTSSRVYGIRSDKRDIHWKNKDY
ncbi:hypothetical protein PHYBLDRAFT_68836 [Phycomyces blakesleeanus NRRL 1555(-)]|uniref:Uncharacterized protein n=1 Tax=Phycomyces blakesleeanus (strain ATCC 8743b / DSM 1359 / FGSC 10004 / NBRC 33097 / NRRL 1555) TaxID=763407 RepID=A0A167KK95_PHYB8|nr:hypothetical protein PHYBLDRAFT_68836 [Phycomyces blakesleeanus NRRL 1555(-)]OAD68289.1 hypothetical protein PHYBLDRAFT_68836 [Phycomyces blakesleeanus NRRL 1555(-)]|eukprot:XP_018286329.1 hypothetical protein PHYBLDRAFT_68836 [Phycomyces blakesleeanus NRRL 1555(-)]